ncbi:hypothetical protein [Streptomyces sp. RKAG337]|uniref:hypothetical protein n=1 Tax=Streptomyces sp. RKAG337 TaxID=2893404 RepID=UPI0020340E9E|nr:hypothetical protein [Streptomyces sp. RKAG337]MCM2431071.1 hypothetical protein [Streptomyces sp. RKAG337]
MTPTRGGRTGPDKQAARRRQQRQMASAPLFHQRPPFQGYQEWLIPHSATGRFMVNADAPAESRAFFSRLEELLLPLYGGRIPLAATYLDDRIREGSIPLAGSGPHMVRRIPIRELAAHLGDHGQPDATECASDLCPQLNCSSGSHDQAEHAVWQHVHHLHAAGRLLLDDHDVVHLAEPPRQPGGRWRLMDEETVAAPRPRSLEGA